MTSHLVRSLNCMALIIASVGPASFAQLASKVEGAVDRDTNLGNGTFDEDILGLSSRHSAIIIDERELLRRYLEEVQKRSAVEIASELAKVEFAREVFRSHDAKWWTQYNDQKQARDRKERNQEYWKEYERGQNWAASLVASGTGNNNCKVLLSQIPTSGNPTDPLLLEAFSRGAVAGAPECFISDLTAPLKALDARLQELNRKLLSAQKRLSFESPDEEKLVELSDRFRDAVATIVKEESIRGRVTLGELLTNYTNQIQKLKPQAEMLAALVGCGAKPRCALRVDPPKKSLTTGASYQVLTNELDLSPYESSVSVLGLMRAVHRFVESNPDSREIVAAQRAALESALSEAEGQHQAQVSAARFDFQTETSQRIRAFRRQNSQLFRSFFSQDERIELIDYLAELKTAMAQFKTFEIGTRIEATLWETLETQYSLALERASTMSLRAELPRQQIVVSWVDEPSKRYVIKVDWPKMVSGYLLGDNANDVQTWVNFLNL
jgi:hypothetical protein